jgi:hypothetical protein
VLFVGRAELPAIDVAHAHIGIARKTPIVFLVLDELPVASLMTPDRAIDATRYPNFARLARDATWYREATTVHEHTTGAVPAILSGKLPERGELPTLQWHPQNLFTLLGGDYRMRVHESLTYLCPEQYCPRVRRSTVRRLGDLFSDVRIAFLHRVLPRSWAGSLPPVSDRWGGFARERILAARDARVVPEVFGQVQENTPQQVDLFLNELSNGAPTGVLHFAHLLTPHSPWRYLPSGRQYSAPWTIDGILEPDHVWAEDPWLVQQAYQRHLLQVGYSDRILGRLLDRLEHERLYSRTLLVVVADHGASFIPGQPRRSVNQENIADVARIPLFVKVPGQRIGHVDSRPAQTIDILPTIADVVGLRLPMEVDGQSLLGPPVARRWITVSRHKAAVEGEVATLERVDRGLSRTLQRKFAWFGKGSRSLFRIGKHQFLLGQAVVDVDTQPRGAARVFFDDEGSLGRVDPLSGFVPARISGVLAGVEGDSVDLAVAVNGRIAAVTRTFREAGKYRFSALTPESAFRDGVNRVEIFVVDSCGVTWCLVPTGSSGFPGRGAAATGGGQEGSGSS